MGSILEKELKPKARCGPQDPFIEGGVQKREDLETDGQQKPDEGGREGLEKFSRSRKVATICCNLGPGVAGEPLTRSPVSLGDRPQYGKGGDHRR